LKVFLLFFFLIPVLIAFLWPGIAALPASPCLFHYLFGTECPTCGLTRGFVAAGRCDFCQSFLLNPLAPILFFVFLILTIVIARDIFLHRALANRLYSHFAPYIGATVACMVVASFAVRLMLKR
jgi:hypothetical protein